VSAGDWDDPSDVRCEGQQGIAAGSDRRTRS
jgi:hypothetical protein